MTDVILFMAALWVYGVAFFYSELWVRKMNLTEFVRKNDIKCNDGEEFGHSPDFFKIKELSSFFKVIPSS